MLRSHVSNGKVNVLYSSNGNHNGNKFCHQQLKRLSFGCCWATKLDWWFSKSQDWHSHWNFLTFWLTLVRMLWTTGLDVKFQLTSPERHDIAQIKLSLFRFVLKEMRTFLFNVRPEPLIPSSSVHFYYVTCNQYYC